MSYIRLFFKESLTINSTAKLDKLQSHYIFNVMRINAGQSFSLFNEGGEWEAKVIEIEKGIIKFVIIKKLRPSEKIRELGVTKFIPILTERTVVRDINKNRINKIIIEAAEQSNRIIVPTLEKLINLDKFLKIYQDTNIIFGDLNSKNNKLNVSYKKPICILIGPEGDLSEKERQKILRLKNISALNINKNILRTETAAISLISIINFFGLSQ